MVPSRCYENFPMCIAEAYACGVPVIASDMGAMRELVAHGRTGLLFRPGDAEHLAESVDWAWSHPCDLEYMGNECRAEFRLNYSAERNYELSDGELRTGDFSPPDCVNRLGETNRNGRGWGYSSRLKKDKKRKIKRENHADACR